MADRKRATAAAIDESVQLASEPEKKPKTRPRDAGSDVDEELEAFFNGGYAADCGLHCGLGNAGKGGGGKIPDGYNNAVKFMAFHGGVGGRLEMSIVTMALQMLKGTPPEPRKRDLEDKQAKARYERRVADWPYYFPVLQGYYKKAPRGAQDPLQAAFGNLAGVVLVTPEARVHAKAWCAQRLAEAILANTRAVAGSKVAADGRLGVLEGRLRMVLAEGGKAWRLRAYNLRRQIAQAKAVMGKPDTERAVKRRWANPSEEDCKDALRALVAASQGSKDTPERVAAKKAVTVVLDRARVLYWDGRTAYVRSKADVKRAIRRVHQHDVGIDSDFKRELGPMIPADLD
jgi:hypothetical protein